MRHREPAICLRAYDYSETSQVVHFLTRGLGVVHLLAKGSKRPKSSTGGAVDLLGEGELVFTTNSRGGLGALIEFSETASRATLRRDAGALNTALYAIELTGAMLAEGDPHTGVFDLLHNALERLGQGGRSTPAVLAYFQWRLLRHVGLLGDLGRCVSCGGEIAGRDAGGVCFSSTCGGLLCDACQGAQSEKTPVDAAALVGIAAIAQAESGHKADLSDEQARAVSRVLAYHVRYQLGKQLKMERFVI